MQSRISRLVVPPRMTDRVRTILAFALAALVLSVAAAGQSPPVSSSGSEPTSSAADDADREAPQEDDAAGAAMPPPSAPAVQEVVVVSANRLAVPAATVGSSVTVLERETIERRRMLTVSDLLRAVPGVELTQTGGLGSTTSVRVRGGDASQTLVLVDGLRANSATTGDFDFSQLLAENLERIEVLRGPQATYGSEAVSGVISIVTRRGDDGLAGRVEGEAGTYGLARLMLAGSGGRGPVDFTASASDLHADGVSYLSARLGGVDDDGFDNRSYSARVGLALAASSRLDLTVRSSDGDAEVDGFLVDDPNARNRTQTLQTGLHLQARLAPFWQQSVRLGVTENDLVGLDPDTPFNNFRIDSRIELVGLQSDVEVSATDKVSFGFDYEERTARNAGAFDEAVRLRSAFVQNLWSYGDRLFLTGAVRHDDHSRFGGETTVRATAAVLFPGSDSRLHGSFGTGFRAPDLNELYYPFAGDPELRPEHSEGWDLGVESGFWGGRARVDVTLFAVDFEDLIDFDLGSFRFANIDSARSRGVEMTADLRPARWSTLALAHTFNDTEDLGSGAALPRRPRQRSSLVWSLDPSSRLRTTWTYVRVRDRIDSDGRPMDDYQRVDLRVDFEVREWIRPYLRLENLLDADYEEVTGFTTPGRVAALGLRLGL